MKGEEAVVKQVSNIHHVSVFKGYETVAIGMGTRNMNNMYGFAIEVQSCSPFAGLLNTPVNDSIYPLQGMRHEDYCC